MALPAASSDPPSPAQPTIRSPNTQRTLSPERHSQPNNLVQEEIDIQLDVKTSPKDEADSDGRGMAGGEKRTSTRSQHEDARASVAGSDTSSEECTNSSRGQRLHQRNQFPFLELPSELRLEIYRMALCRPKPVLLHMPRTVVREDPASEKDCFSDSSVSSVETTWRRESTGQRRLVRKSLIPEYKQKPVNFWLRGINEEPLVPALLCVSKLVHREAKPVLYSENEFTLWLPTALCTLMHLHQRSRSLIKHIRVRLPTYHDILDRFSELVRLGLRYCWGLKTLTISLPEFPYDRNAYGPNTPNVYVNAFHILRWLPKQTLVRLDAYSHDDIRRVVEENCRVAGMLSEVSYQRKMMSPDSVPDKEIT